jgi:preprotein translocase subunit YajC
VEPIFIRILIGVFICAAILMGMFIDNIAERANKRRQDERKRMLASLRADQRTFANNYGRDLF